MKVEDLKFDKRNYRRHNDRNKELIKKSIEEVGFGRSIVIDSENEIVCGNGVVSQADKKTPVKVVETDGSELVVIKRTDLKTSDAKRKQLAVMDNSASDSSEFDFELLQEDFDTEELQDWGLDVDFAIEEEKEVIEDEVPEEVETRCKLGDIWQLGEHRLMCGDSTKVDDVEKLMNGEKADMVLTDPPYNVNIGQGGGSICSMRIQNHRTDGATIKNDNMADNDFYNFLLEVFKCLIIFTKPGGAFYIWHADTQGLNFRLALKDAGLTVRQCLIWNKSQLVMGRQDYQWKHEPCLYGWVDGSSHKFYNDRKQTTVIDFERPQKSPEHPTMKPVGLFDYQIKNNTKGSDIVLDLFGGSGTTMIACEQNGRKARLMELDPHYCDVIIQRWENLTGKEAVLCS